MIGIYKITNPKNKVYIGQSVRVEKRLLSYKKFNCEDQFKVYNSLKKYGIESHTFEIIKECSLSELNFYERHYQDLFNCIKDGLNCKYTATHEKSGHLSEETKNKISSSQKGKKRIYKSGIHPRLGKKLSEETIYKMVHNREKYVVSEEYKKRLSEMYKGKKQTAEHSEKRRIANIGKKRSEETKLKQSILKQKMTEETKKKMSLAKIGTKQSEETKLKRSESMKKTIQLKKLNSLTL